MKFRIEETETDWLKNDVGVRQGCIMSQTVFNTYIEELFVRIRKAEVRVRIGNNKLGCIGYADDVVLTAE